MRFLSVHREEIAIRGGEEKAEKRGIWEACFASTILCKSIKTEASFWSLYWCCFSLRSISLSLVNPTRCRPLFTPEKATGEEGRHAGARNLTGQPNAIQNPSVSKESFSSSSSSLCLIAIFRCFPSTLLPFLMGIFWTLQKCNINMLPPLLGGGRGSKGGERSRMIHLRWPESGFLSAQLIKIPGTQECRVWCTTSRWSGFNMHELTAPASADWHSLSLPVRSLGSSLGIWSYWGHTWAKQREGGSLSPHWYNSVLFSDSWDQ